VRVAALAFLVLLTLAGSPVAAARVKNSGSHSPSAGVHHNSSYAAGVPRDAHGRIARDPRARNEFRRNHPCPSTGKASGSCPGYVIDHVQPLKRGGADTPANMQWQTEGAAKLKDRTE
jgi:hypothetical protein